MDFDIDIDVPNREEVLKHLSHTSASIIKNDTIENHKTGVYVQEVPIDEITGLCSLDYKIADSLGYMKIDILNNTAYLGITDRDHLKKLVSQSPDWSLLDYKEVVETLFHIHNHYDIVSKLKPDSIEKLAMVLAIIRPGKRHLVDKTWLEIEQEIWTKGADGYEFKKSHAHSYALLIVMQLNLLSEA